jgi:alpha-soluble NSF attachment protein
MKPQKGCHSELSSNENIDILFLLVACTELKLAWQDLAASMDEGDVAKFTDAVKEFDSMTRLVLSIGILPVISFVAFGRCSSIVGPSPLHEVSYVDLFQDPWKTTLLLKAKNELKKKEDDEDDLT